MFQVFGLFLLPIRRQQAVPLAQYLVVWAVLDVCQVFAKAAKRMTSSCDAVKCFDSQLPMDTEETISRPMPSQSRRFL